MCTRYGRGRGAAAGISGKTLLAEDGGLSRDKTLMPENKNRYVMPAGFSAEIMKMKFAFVLA